MRVPSNSPPTPAPKSTPSTIPSRNPGSSAPSPAWRPWPDTSRRHASTPNGPSRSHVESQNVAIIANALQGTAFALQRDDPAAALAAAEEFLDLHRTSAVGTGAATALNVAGAIYARLGDDIGALARLHDAVTIARDQGVRPQLTAALDWSLGPLLRTGRPDVTATLLGALTDGALADVSQFPNVADGRSRNLERVRDLLGDQTDAHIARGAAMSYNELTDYALSALESA